MDLILKPTALCNFKCDFCSSTKLSNSFADYLDIKYVFDFLNRFPNTTTIIINGGDPTMVSPDYYWKIIEFLDKNNLKTNLSFTSNLWDFFKNPNKWTDLFKHQRCGVNTSFQYDPPGKTGRLKPDFSQFTVDDFWKISDLMLEKVGYRPDFISVIDDNNKHLAIKNVELAKEMSNGLIPKGYKDNEIKFGVECKLNYVMSSGKIRTFKNGLDLIYQGASNSMFVMADIYEIYVDIYNKGLAPWEFATKEMAKVIKNNGNTTVCPLNKKTCDSGIRCLQPTTNPKSKKDNIENSYYSCGALADDSSEIAKIDYKKEIYENQFFTPLQKATHLYSLKNSCLNCPMFNICNGCWKTNSDFKKKGGNIIEQHCKKMKSLAPEILRINGFSEEEINLKLTPYKQEYYD